MVTEEGTGVLVNLPSEGSDDHLFTELEHGDIELIVEFLVPKGSNSGLYFQGRYEIQILDSWGKKEADFYDVGGIYERWDASRPAGERGYEGHAPPVNAAFAPGLWQEFHILFRAPRFDETGSKTRNARFERVYLNGVLLHEDVEVTGPTRAAAFDDETERAPFMIQGDHGPVAFRNFRYKTYERTDSLRLGPLEYRVYDYVGVRLPDFNTLTDVLAEGVTDSFLVADLSPKDEYYAMWFTGELEVPVSGDYLFQTRISNAGNLYINGDLVIPNDGEIDSHLLGTIIHLQEGTHRLDMSYFQRTWNRDLLLFYEGPEMERRTLASSMPSFGGPARDPLIVHAGPDEPELIGGFVNHGGQKRTHTLSVGTPQGVHYTYDLNNASLLQFWRNPFADVTQMWRGRGEEQLLVTVNAAVEMTSGIPVARMHRNSLQLYENVPELPGVQEYTINDAGLPVFIYEIDGISVEDQIRPSGEYGLTRTIRYRSGRSRNDVVGAVARGERLELLNNGLYRVNGNYYVQLAETGGEEAAIVERDGMQILVIPVLRETDQSEIQYRIIW